MNPRWCVGVALVAAVGDLGRAQQVPEAVSSKVRALLVELAPTGMNLAPDALVLEVRQPADFEAGIARELEATFGPGHFEVLRQLHQALALDSGRSTDELRSRAARRLAEASSCRYDFERDVLAFAADKLERADGDDLDIVVELARAWRDRQTDLAPWFARPPRTSEATRVRETWLAGQSGLAALAVRESRARRQLTGLHADSVGSLPWHTGADEASELAGARGVDLWLRAFHAQGWQVLTANWETLPASTEAALHLPKYGRDLPRAVELPAWPESAQVAEVVHDDTLGEMELLGLLRGAGVEEAPARLAAIGWDGDRLQLLRSKSGELALVWRLVFDRGEDARQFSALWNTKVSGHLRQRGPTVDWLRGDSVRWMAELTRVLDAAPAEITPDPADKQSAEMCERGVQPNQPSQPRIEGDRWFHPRYDLSIGIPPGWSPGLLNGQPYLMGASGVGFRDMVGVTALENLEGKSLEALLGDHRAAIGAAEGSRLEIGELRKIGGREAIFLRYTITHEGQVLHLTSVAFAVGAKQVLVTATITDARWNEASAVIDALMSDLRFTTTSTPPKKPGGK